MWWRWNCEFTVGRGWRRRQWVVGSGLGRGVGVVRRVGWLEQRRGGGGGGI